MRVPSDPLRVTNASLPTFNSGDQVDSVIPLEGGCGGPYVLKVIEGRMPDGCSLDAATHAIKGYVLEDGTFDFRLQITDTGCDPFQSTVANFHMNVSVGSLTVVQALLDGVPSLLRPGDPNYDTTLYGQKGPYPALPAIVYGQFTTISLVVAGGVKPYEAAVTDDPANPNDGPLPTGTVIPEKSTSITGTPSEVGDGGGPFLVTVRVKDHAGLETFFTFYWLIRTPPIVIATDGLPDGTCGLSYSQAFFIVDGVPPFTHELTATGPGVGNSYTQSAAPDTTGDIVYEPPAPPTVPDPGLLEKIDATWYPAPDDTEGETLDYAAAGYVTPPEGLRMEETIGALQGIPRRTGKFLVNYHVRSALVPNNYGQHGWATFEFSFAEAPPVAHDPAYTVEGEFLPYPYSSIPDAEQGKPYNPDGGESGLQLLATGGVPADGWTDAPHASQAQDITGTGPGLEWPGSYTWTVDYDPDANGGNDPIPGMELVESQGIWRCTDPDLLVKQLPQELAFKAIDAQLPTSYHTTATQKVRFGVGPDTVIVTESSSSCTFNTYYGGFPQNDTTQKVEVVEMGSDNSSTLRDLAAADMSGTGEYLHTVPETAGTSVSISDLLSSIDILNVSINPTGWWDDRYHLNPNGARGFQHGEQNRYYPYLGGPSHVYYYMSSTPSYPAYYMAMPNVTAVQFPPTKGVTAAPLQGVHTDGGKMYAFDSADYFGIFIIYRDGRLYVPAAFDKDTYQSFGDNWTYGYTTNTSSQNYPINKIPQFTMSPDGRFGALKLRTSTSFDQYERADTTDIVIFTLTGERLWDGKTYKVIQTGASGTSTSGEVLFASSLTLTDKYLYYIVGNSYGGSWYYASWRDHYIYRYELEGGEDAGALLSHPNDDSDWAQTNTSKPAPMQTPFQQFDRPFAGSYPDYAMIQCTSYNSHENGMAPHPFRVSADGMSCVIVAGRSTTQTYGNEVLQHHIWVDSPQGLAKLTTSPRRFPHAGGRGYALQEGPSYFGIYCWGSWTGPSTALEISDDGSKVAAVYYDYSGTEYHYSYSYWYQYSEHVLAFTQKNGTDWTGGANQIEVTKPYSSTSIVWHFGALVFTKDNDGLVFWGGYCNGYPSGGGTYYYMRSWSYVGSMYGYDFTQSTPGIYSLLASSAGGRNATLGTKYTTSGVNSPSTGSWQTDGGVIKPIGGFLSKNREFLYMVNRGSLLSSGGPEHGLIAVNVRSVNTSQSKNGHTDFRGFLVGGLGTQRGFQPAYSYPSSYAIGSYSSANYYWYCVYYAPGGTYGAGYQASDVDHGWVFFANHYQASGTYTYQSDAYGGPDYPTWTYDYGYYGGHVDVFDPNVGGAVQQLTPSAFGTRNGTDVRAVMFVDVADDGSQVAFVFRAGSYYYYFDRDRLGFVGNISLNPSTGVLQSGSIFAKLHDADSRAAETFAHYTPRGRIYAAWGITNENNRKIYMYAPDGSSTNEIQLNHGPARFNVLNAAR